MRIVETYKTNQYDTHRTERGDIIDFLYNPFYQSDEAVIDVIASVRNRSVTGRAVAMREMDIHDGKLTFRYKVTLNLDGKRITDTYDVSEHAYFHPNKRSIYLKVLKLMERVLDEESTNQG